DGASGYYVPAYDSGLLARVLENATSLSAAEHVSLLRDLRAQANAGHAKASEALQAAQIFAASPERQGSEQVRGIVAGVRELLPVDLLPNYARYVCKLFAARAAELGWSAKPGEDEETRLLRTALVPFVAHNGEEPNLQAEARRLAEGWLKDRKGPDADMLPAVLSAAARSGNQELFNGMLRALQPTKDPHERQALIGALGSFRDSKIVQQSLNLLLDPNLDIRE